MFDAGARGMEPGTTGHAATPAEFEAWVAQLAATLPAPDAGDGHDPDRHADGGQPGPTGLVDLMAGLERVKAACAAAQVRATAAFVQARVTHQGPIGHHDPRPHTVQLTTPTGHTHTSTAPPALPGTSTPPQDEQAIRDRLRSDILKETGYRLLRLVA